MTLRSQETRAVIVGIETYGAGTPWELNGPALDACRFAGMTAGLVAEGVGTLGALQDFDATVAAMDRYEPAIDPA